VGIIKLTKEKKVCNFNLQKNLQFHGGF